jgi:hypothetical protein
MVTQKQPAQSSELSPAQALLQMTAGHWIAQAIYVAAKLGIADLLRDGPRSSEEAGLTEIGNEGVSRIVRGGEAEARLNCATLQAFMERGILSQTEYADLQSAFFDPSFSFITRTIGVAWGKRAH